MKGNSKKFLALLLSASMTLSPVLSVQAQEVVTEAQTEVMLAAEPKTAETTAAETTAPVTETTAETTAPVTETTAETTAPVTETTAETTAPVTENAGTEAATEAATTENVTETATETEVVTETIAETGETVTEAITESLTETATEAVTEAAYDTVPETEAVEEVVDDTKMQDVNALSSEAPDTESASEPDTDGATRAVDSSTTLADGVYKAESITVTGGSGKTSFECTKITVSGRQASATIVIGSNKYTYVKANAQKYNTVIGAKTATVTFPVDLNEENAIIGYTTAMGGKEIAYTVLLTLAEDSAVATTETPDSVSVSEKDNSAFTKTVDNSTTLKDAVYIPDAFTYAGGKNTVFECSKVTVSEGKAFATVVIKSANYDYVKANGYKYTAVQDANAKTSTVVIPVELNVENTVVGHTTAMGGKEISYTITVTLNEETQASTSESPSEGETTATESESSSGSDSSDYADGDYNLGITSDFSMFGLVSSAAKVVDGKIMVTLTTNKAHYDKFSFGTKETADKTNYIAGTSNGNGYDFTFEVTKDMLGQTLPVFYGKTDGTWYSGSKQFNLTIPASLEAVTPETDSEKQTESELEVPSDTAKTADGNYIIDVQSSAAMFKVIEAVVKARGGVYTAEITLSGTGYDLLYMGSKEDAVKADASQKISYTVNEDGKYVFTIPVSALDAPIAVAAHSVKNDTWYDRTLTFKSETMKDAPVDVANGDYNVTVESSAAMFKVINCVMKAENGICTAEITLSGTGYDLLYMGTKEDAAKTDASQKISYTLNGDGKYVFTVPVKALDVGIAVAAHSVKNDTWYDRTLTFKSEGMIMISEEESESETETETEKPGKNPDKESSYETDLSGSTGAVNSSTALADGVYTPDKFSWSGGSGKVSISCSKITVSGGQAYATIVFSSSNYGYVKANGRKYTGTVTGGGTSFTIPVELNANNTIIGMTTAMSAAHEITYNIYVYLAAADKAAGDKTNGEGSVADAPEIVGLNYQSETKMEHAQLIHIYNYDDGITLVEIDMSTDVEWEEESETETETAVVETEAVVSEEEGEVPVQTKEEIMAELYKEDVVRYLVVPEGVEIPVGLEKEMVLVNIPAESVYVASTETLDVLNTLEQTEKITAAGFTAEECQIESIQKAMEEENIAYAGDMENLEFRTLLLSRCDLALFTSEILPNEEADSEEYTERYEEVSSGFATLGVPMIVDRSADEETEEAKAEWTKLYEILFECGETNEE